ncbi:NAD(P)H-hydrate dehydratase, partial [Roseisolibacter sp. H3M3-2]|uniref:ADP-dependent NAD(P)H-hydrate dehydratase n=1 Tax=Roseisolibacter sp. H3M3-2 TaxID=3031323 RepID=UPI0023DCE2D3
LTPHAGAMAALLGVPRAEVDLDAREVARLAAARYGATVALKGAESWIAEPDGALLRFRGGAVGLGTSGSGDTLAGIVAGQAARGAAPTTAATWGVWAHGTAGRILARRTATVGYLARELLAEVPALVGRA